MDPQSKGNADAAQGVRSHEGRWTPGDRGEVLHFDYLYVGDSGSRGKLRLEEKDDFKHVLVMIDDLSNFVWLEPMEFRTAESTANHHLLGWCKTLGVPEA